MPDSCYAPYLTAEEEPTLHPSSVALLDLLGTSQGTLSEAEQALAVTHAALKHVGPRIEGIDGIVQTRWFSDNCIVAAPEKVGAFADLSYAAVILVAAAVQLEFAFRGLFLRGGAAFGDFFMSRDFVYGHSLVAAHELESRVAVYPRVVLSHAFVSKIRQDWEVSGDGFPAEIYRDVLAIDHDGAVFVDYLQLVSDFAGSDDIDWLVTHRRHIEEQTDVHRGNERLTTKYGWASNYHDRYCSWRFKDEPARLEQLLIAPDRAQEITPFRQQDH